MTGIRGASYEKQFKNRYEIKKEWCKLVSIFRKHGLKEVRDRLEHEACDVRVRYWVDLRLMGPWVLCVEVREREEKIREIYWVAHQLVKYIKEELVPGTAEVWGENKGDIDDIDYEINVRGVPNVDEISEAIRKKRDELQKERRHYVSNS